MFILSVKDKFSAAHRIEYGGGKCENLHGHNFVVEVYVSGEKLKEGGMLVDFRTIKDLLRKVLETIDHKYLNEIPYFQTRQASSEFIATYIFEELERMLNVEGVSLIEVKVWESPDACACYRRNP